MKSLSLFLFMILFSSVTYAQTVNGQPISEIENEYIQIIGTERFLSNKMKIDIDFGQRDKVFKVGDTRVEDAEGKLVTFNSMMQALNFMYDHGYEFVQAMHITEGEDIENTKIHYILRKKQAE